jgi:hypothetical protein
LQQSRDRSWPQGKVGVLIEAGDASGPELFEFLPVRRDQPVEIGGKRSHLTWAEAIETGIP